MESMHGFSFGKKKTFANLYGQKWHIQCGIVDTATDQDLGGISFNPHSGMETHCECGTDKTSP